MAAKAKKPKAKQKAKPDLIVIDDKMPAEAYTPPAKPGRPTEYNPAYADMMYEYFNVPAGENVQRENSKGEIVNVWIPSQFPTLAGFARKIGHDRGTLAEWAKIHPEFSRAYKEAQDHQEAILVENGLMEGYNASFSIFTAKNVLGWRDKTDISATVFNTDRPADLTNRVLGGGSTDHT